MQHHARPAGAEHHIHLARRRRHRFQIDHSLPNGVVDGTAPGLRLDEARIALAPAIAVAAGLLAVAVASHDRYVDPHHRADVAIDLAVGAQDFDDLPGRAEARADLPHARVFGARIGVDFLQQLHLGLEARRIERIFVAIEADIGAAGRVRIAPAIAALDRANRVGGADQGGFREVGSMGVAHRLVLHRAQPETLGGVIGRLFQPAIVEGERFRLAVFEEQFAVVGTFEAARNDGFDAAAVEPGAVDEGSGGGGHGGSVFALGPNIGRRVGHREGSPSKQISHHGKNALYGWCGGFDVPISFAASPSSERQIQSRTRIIELLVSFGSDAGMSARCKGIQASEPGH